MNSLNKAHVTLLLTDQGLSHTKALVSVTQEVLACMEGLSLVCHVNIDCAVQACIPYMLCLDEYTLKACTVGRHNSMSGQCMYSSIYSSQLMGAGPQGYVGLARTGHQCTWYYMVCS